MIKKVHNYLNFATIILVLGLMVGVIITLLMNNPADLVSNVSDLLAGLTPEASIWLDALSKNVDVIQRFYDILIISLVFGIMLFFISISVFSLIILRKKYLSITRVSMSIVLDVMMIIFIIKILSTFILSSYFVVNIFALCMLVVVFAQLILGIVLIYKWYLLTRENEEFGMELKHAVSFLVRLVSVILVVYFTANIAFVLISNLVIDTLINNIHIAQMLGSSVIGTLDFNIPLNELLPEQLVTFLNERGFALQKTLADLGVNNATVNTFLNSYVFAPIDAFIHNLLNDFTNRFIFKDFVAKLAVLFITLGFAITYQVRVIPNVIRNIVSLVGMVTITIILAVVLNYFLFVNAIIIMLIAVIICLLVLIVTQILSNKNVKGFVDKEINVASEKIAKRKEKE